MPLTREQREHFENEQALQDESSLEETLSFFSSFLKQSSVCLDIGTGIGNPAVDISKKAGWVIASDPDAGLLHKCKSRIERLGISNMELTQCCGEDLPFKNETLDIVTCRFVLHHCSSPTKVLCEIHRVLEKDGKFLLVDTILPDDMVEIWSITSLLRYGAWKPYFTYRDHMKMLDDAGFAALAMKPFDFRTYVADFIETGGKETEERLRQIILNLTPEQKGKMRVREEDGELVFYHDSFNLVAEKNL